jgi:hypothetical protein
MYTIANAINQTIADLENLKTERNERFQFEQFNLSKDNNELDGNALIDTLTSLLVAVGQQNVYMVEELDRQSQVIQTLISRQVYLEQEIQSLRRNG